MLKVVVVNNKKFDHIINDRLQDFESPVSQDMWDRIDSNRSWQTKLANQVRASWLPFSLVATFFCASAYYLSFGTSTTTDFHNSDATIQEQQHLQQAEQIRDLPPSLSKLHNSMAASDEATLADAETTNANWETNVEAGENALLTNITKEKRQKVEKNTRRGQHNASEADYTINKNVLSQKNLAFNSKEQLIATANTGRALTNDRSVVPTTQSTTGGQQADANGFVNYDWRQPLVKHKDKITQLESASATMLDRQANGISDENSHLGQTSRRANAEALDTNKPLLRSAELFANKNLALQQQERVAQNGLLALDKHMNTIAGILSNTAEAATCPRFKESLKKGYVSVDVIVSPEYAYRTLQSDDGGMSSYIQHREDTEQFDGAFSTGVRLGYNMVNGLSIRTGLEYSQVTEIYTHTEDAGFTITLTPVDTIETADNGQVILYDTTSVVPQYNYVDYTNRYRTVNVPILLGYNIEANRLVLSVNGGVLLNLRSSAKGKVASTYDLNPANIETVNTKGQDMRLGLYGSLGFNYKLTNEMHLIAEPSVRYMLDPMYETPIKQNYYALGLTTGLRWHF